MKVTTVFVLWLHDSVLGVFSTRRKALLAARRFRSQAEYRDCEWVYRRSAIGMVPGADKEAGFRMRWHTVLSARYGPHVSRLEVEPREVR